MSTGPKILLASASPRRAAVFAQLGLAVEVTPSDVDEMLLPEEEPETHVERLAREKVAAAPAPDGALVVGGDTVVVHRGRILGKPASESEAVEMLLGMAGDVHEVFTGLAVREAGRTVAGVARAEVRFRRFGPEDATGYAASGEPLDKAGAYGIQGLGAALVEEIRGDYYTVVGFPVGLFLDLLSRLGWRYDFGRLTPTQVP